MGRVPWRSKRKDRWFAIQTNPRSERKAAAELRRAGLRVYIPNRSYEQRNRKGGTNMRHRPLLVGYIFVRFPAAMYDRWGTPPFDLARQCQGVRAFVRVADARGEWAPFSVPDKDVRSFIRRQRMRQFGRPAVETAEEKLAKLQAAMPPGTLVRVMEGPFASFLASLERLTADGRAEVEVDVMGRATKVTIELYQVQVEPRSASA